jgi:hypothetical protein
MKAIPKQIEWFDDRFYRVEHEGVTYYLASVTTILGIINKPFISHWRGEVGNERANQVMNEAQDRGSRIHHACYLYSGGGIVLNDSWKMGVFDHETRLELSKRYNGKIIVLSQEEFLPFYRYVQFFELVKPTVILSESAVYSVEMGCAGTVDVVMDIAEGEYEIGGSETVKLEGGLYTVDIKTGKQISDEYYLQVAGYDKLLQDDFDKDDLKGALVLHLEAQTKKGIEGFKAHHRTREMLDADLEDFERAKHLFYRQNKTLKPKVFELPTYATMYPEMIGEDSNDKEPEATDNG